MLFKPVTFFLQKQAYSKVPKQLNYYNNLLLSLSDFSQSMNTESM